MVDLVLDKRTKAMLDRRKVNEHRLGKMAAQEVVYLVMISAGSRQHTLGCTCSGITEATGLTCNELWNEVKRIGLNEGV